MVSGRARSKYQHRVENKHTLNGCGHSLLLQTADVLSGKLARQERVLGERLEISAAKGVAMQAHSRPQQDVGGSCLRLVAKMLADAVQNVPVPCCCQGDTTREEGGLESRQYQGSVSFTLEKQHTEQYYEPWFHRQKCCHEHRSGHPSSSRLGFPSPGWPLCAKSRPL